MFKGLTARRLFNTFGVKWLTSANVDGEARPALHPRQRKESRYVLNRRSDGTWCISGCFGKQRNPCLCRKSNLESSASHPVPSLMNIPTEPSWLATVVVDDVAYLFHSFS
jgi:hypothetical protein